MDLPDPFKIPSILFKIVWTEGMTNEDVLRRMNKYQELTITIKHQKNSICGSIIVHSTTYKFYS